MSSGRVVDEMDVKSVAMARARGEAAEVRMLVRYRDAEEARVAGPDSPMRRMVEKTAIATTIGVATGRSDGQVINLLAMADRVMAELPQVWDAFGSGDRPGAGARAVAGGGEARTRRVQDASR